MQPIGIFDSGVGGLGIFKAIAQQLPEQDLIYFADNNNLPFGQKTTEQLQQITSKILDYLISTHNIKIAVVACNTASVSSLSYLREKYPTIPIVGAVPVIKPACELSKNKKVAILATLHTTNSEYQKQLIAQYGSGVEVLSIACPDLVDLVEAGLFDDPHTQEKLQEYLSPAIALGVDVVGLACTHYPFLRVQIQKLLPEGVIILDSNDAVARQVVKVQSKILASNALDKQPGFSEKTAKYSFYVTKEPEKFQVVARKLLGEIIDSVSLISL
ncbi:MAG: glutamate racemase [Candidatus Babeliales bacterium]|jgi:glutamate racemase|nr:MAG: Glutamate racemase [candidate division TM6 bacterium GW2011_GWF2_36_6]